MKKTNRAEVSVQLASWWLVVVKGGEGICRSVFVGLDAFPSLVPGGKQLPGRGSANGEKVAQSGSTASLRRWNG